jgi:hypothetical protein
MTRGILLGTAFLATTWGIHRLMPDGNWLWIGMTALGSMALGVVIRDIMDGPLVEDFPYDGTDW